MRRILIVTYHFPPDAEIGGVRPYQFARHLPEFGFEPWVLTVEPAYAESPDPGYQAIGIPPERIVRTTVNRTLRDRLLSLWKSSRPSSSHNTSTAGMSNPADPKKGARKGGQRLRHWLLGWLEFPDPRVGWRAPALEAGLRLAAAQRLDVVLSTSPPRVAHMIGAAIATRHRIPWVMDLRDPWYSPWYRQRDGSVILSLTYRSLLKSYSRRAALIVTNTEPLRTELQQTISRARRLVCLPNGFDPESSVTTDDGLAEFSLGYFGQMSGSRSAAVFLLGLRQWLDRQESAPGRVRVRFVGSGFDDAQRLARQLGLDVVSFETPVPRSRVWQLIAEQYGLLLFANEQPMQVPGKAYEYLASSRRILAGTEHKSATAALLGRAPGCTIAVTPDDVARTLTQWRRDYDSGVSAVVGRRDFLAPMSYRVRSEALAGFLQNVTPPVAEAPASISLVHDR